MLFGYSTSSKKLKSIGLGLVINLIGFIAFTFFIKYSVGLGIIFLGSFFMNLFFFFQRYKNRTHFEFFENEIRVHTPNESKNISDLSLLCYDVFQPYKNSKEHIYLLSSEGEYQFVDDGDDNYETVKTHLASRIPTNVLANYHFHIRTIKERVPGLICSMLLLLAYVYFFDVLGFKNIIFQVFIFIQAGTLLIHLIQWINYQRKIKSHS
jgi:hypothetical protein